MASADTARRMDSFFAMQSGRSDLWREALTAAHSWASGDGSRAAVEASCADLAIIEEFHAYPGCASDGPAAGEDRGGRCRGRRRTGQAVLRCHSHRLLFVAGGAGRRGRRWRCPAGCAAHRDLGPGSAAALFRSAVCHPPARVAVACDLRGDAPPAPRRGLLHLRAGRGRQLRGRDLRRHRQSEDPCRDRCRGGAVPLDA